VLFERKRRPAKDNSESFESFPANDKEIEFESICHQKHKFPRLHLDGLAKIRADTVQHPSECYKVQLVRGIRCT
jgi:hypothetical protein